MASNFIQLSTPSLIDAYHNEPSLWDVNMNASEEEELAWARLSTMFNTSHLQVPYVYDMGQILSIKPIHVTVEMLWLFRIG